MASYPFELKFYYLQLQWTRFIEMERQKCTGRWYTSYDRLSSYWASPSNPVHYLLFNGLYNFISRMATRRAG